ncbi:MAG: helix-turn-helix transcriptional regulator [Candidatus Binatia bacterium]
MQTTARPVGTNTPPPALLKLNSVMTLTRLHRMTGMGIDHLSRIFSRQTKPSITNANTICSALGVSLDDFYKTVYGKQNSRPKA